MRAFTTSLLFLVSVSFANINNFLYVQCQTTTIPPPPPPSPSSLVPNPTYDATSNASYDTKSPDMIESIGVFDTNSKSAPSYGNGNTAASTKKASTYSYGEPSTQKVVAGRCSRKPSYGEKKTLGKPKNDKYNSQVDLGSVFPSSPSTLPSDNNNNNNNTAVLPSGQLPGQLQVQPSYQTDQSPTEQANTETTATTNPEANPVGLTSDDTSLQVVGVDGNSSAVGLSTISSAENNSSLSVLVILFFAYTTIYFLV